VARHLSPVSYATGNEGKHESKEKAKARKQDHSWASAEFFQVGGQRRHFLYHFQIADDQCSL